MVAGPPGGPAVPTGSAEAYAERVPNQGAGLPGAGRAPLPGGPKGGNVPATRCAVRGAIDLVLDEVEGGEFADPRDAAAAVMAAVFRINEELSRIVNEDDKERMLRRWVARLIDGVGTLSERFDTLRFSLSVGWPPSVDATVGWVPARPSRPTAGPPS
jgi:hypothetical protein